MRLFLAAPVRVRGAPHLAGQEALSYYTQGQEARTVPLPFPLRLVPNVPLVYVNLIPPDTNVEQNRPAPKDPICSPGRHLV
jgi:hypothetical protein